MNSGKRTLVSSLGNHQMAHVCSGRDQRTRGPGLGGHSCFLRGLSSSRGHGHRPTEVRAKTRGIPVTKLGHLAKDMKTYLFSLLIKESEIVEFSWVHP